MPSPGASPQSGTMLTPACFARSCSASSERTTAVLPPRSRNDERAPTAAATPTPLIQALTDRRDLENVRIYHLHTAGPAPFAAPGREREFRSVSLFTGSPLRAAVAEGRADFVPIFLSDVPGLFLSGQVKSNDVSLLQTFQKVFDLS